MLDREREIYAAHEAEWAKVHAGKFVVVKGDTLVGAFDTIDEALAAGAVKFGLSPFLVRQVGQPAQAVRVPALSLGLLRADP